MILCDRPWLCLFFGLMALMPACISSIPAGSKPRMAPDSESKATIYLINDTYCDGTILVAGTEIGTLPNDKYTWFQIAPGSFVIGLNDASQPSRKLSSRQFVVQAHQTYFIRYFARSYPTIPLVEMLKLASNPSKGVEIYRPEDLEPVSKDVADALISCRDLVGNSLP